MKRTILCHHGRLKFPLGHGSVTLGVDIQPMLTSNHIYYNPPKLRKRLDDEGYLYFKNIVPKEMVDKAFEDVANQLIENSWLTEKSMHDAAERDGFVLDLPFPTTPLPPPKAGFRMTTNIADAIGGANVMTVVRQVLSGGVELLPRKELELSMPGESHGFHVDNIFQNRGTKLVINAWVPLHHTTLTHGPMCVVRGSNSHDVYSKIRSTYGAYDIEAGDIHGDGSFTYHPQELQKLSTLSMENEDGDIIKENVCPLVTSSFDPGDLVITTCYTMHSFLTNTSPFWRFSGETKWIMEGDDVGPDPRYVPEPYEKMAVGLDKWHATMDNKELRPRSMNDAKRDWGLVADGAAAGKATTEGESAPQK